jgi:hypothetical protein
LGHCDTAKPRGNRRPRRLNEVGDVVGVARMGLRWDLPATGAGRAGWPGQAYVESEWPRRGAVECHFCHRAQTRQTLVAVAPFA